MTKDTLRFKSALVLILGLSLLSFSTFARADGERGERARHGHFQHRHHDGLWYSHDEVVVVQRAPSIQVNL
jgi:hypothetical protein